MNLRTILGFRRCVNKIFTLLGCYAAYIVVIELLGP